MVNDVRYHIYQKNLELPEICYNNIDRELIAVNLVIRQFQYFIEEQPFFILTDSLLSTHDQCYSSIFLVVQDFLDKYDIGHH